MRRSHAAGTAVAAPAGRGGDAPATIRGGSLVIEGGTLLDPNTGEVTENAVVAIEDGTVRTAGRRGSVTVPRGAELLDAHGRWVLPGLVDAHIHLSTAAEARAAVLKGRAFPSDPRRRAQAVPGPRRRAPGAHGP